MKRTNSHERTPPKKKKELSTETPTVTWQAVGFRAITEIQSRTAQGHPSSALTRIYNIIQQKKRTQFFEVSTHFEREGMLSNVSPPPHRGVCLLNRRTFRLYSFHPARVIYEKSLSKCRTIENEQRPTKKKQHRSTMPQWRSPLTPMNLPDNKTRSHRGFATMTIPRTDATAV